MKRSTILGAAVFVGIWAGNAITGYAQGAEATTTTTVTGATGTITQLNYGNNGEVQGFLIGTNVLLSFQSNICGGLSILGVVGNSVTYSGSAVTATSGFESVQVSSFTNNTTKATYTATTATTPAYGPTSGTVKQLNYAMGGGIDGFLFTASGSTAPILVFTGANAGTALTSLLTVGSTVSVTGTTAVGMSACSSTATLESVNASSLTIGSQTIVITGGGNGGPGGGRGGPGGSPGGGPGPH
jgi:hypothetical protein